MRFGNWVEPFRDVAAALVAGLTAYVPRVAGALTVLLLGWLLGKLLRVIVQRLLRRGIALVPARLLGAERDEWGALVVRLLGGMSFWLALLFAAGAAAEVLGFSALTGGLSGFAGYVPRLISAVLVLMAGFVVGNLAASWMRATASSARIAYGNTVAKAARAMIVMVAGVVALAQAGIDSTLLVVAVSIVLGAFLGAASLAFGLGARATVANIIGAHYFQRAYRVNQRVRIGAHEGRILEIQPTGVLLETSDGVLLIPASAFTEQSSMLVDEDET